MTTARDILERCRILASHSEESGRLTRTFLCPAMHAVHSDVRRWMEQAGMTVHVDPAGNIHGRYPGDSGESLIIGSHLDTVPDAGMFDGPLGVLLGIGLVEALAGRTLPFPIEIVGFSEEEGVRFGVPFIGSRALTGELDDKLLARQDAHGVSISEAIRNFGLDPSRMREAAAPSGSYLEFHIEQGPVLDSLHLPLGIVETIVGQTRAELQFHGHANHAGTTPMHLRRDALACASEWIGVVEREASVSEDLVATVGRVEVKPGAGNVVPGLATVSLDVRHPRDPVRQAAVDRLLGCASQIAARREVTTSSTMLLDQPAVDMDAGLTSRLASAIGQCGLPVHKMNSGAGHDAMVMARRMPAAMLFLRSPGGISHHPDESVLEEDIAAALKAGLAFLDRFHV
ncbi:MAG TPA: allantoate amidohydrolase [Candidatus Acidoferrales bacterium]